jgi:zinc protease
MITTRAGQWHPRKLALALALGAAAGLAGCAGSAKRGTTDQYVRTVEDIHEYRLENGLQVLLFPDETRSSVTVNTTYFVGSRHESYGETGMAHLLEHMLFYGTEKHPDIKAEISERGGRANGTTWYDRTNYFQTFPATQENLAWAISMEADRMVNGAFTAEDLASEMTVVRNEFEMGENSPFRVLWQRVFGVAYEWHGYGRSTIGARSDIENVPMERLFGFYRRYYQPDNAMVVVTGNFDKDEALAKIEREFGRIPAPDRTGDRQIWDTYTREPTQDGERSVTVRRVGDSQYLLVAHHVPAGPHELFPAVDLLAHVLGNEPSGRLYKALVEPGLASSVSSFALRLREPSMLMAFAEVPTEQDVDEVRRIMLETLDEAARGGVEEAEVQRARNARLRDFESTLNDSAQLGVALTEWASGGDWRMIFVHRDRLTDVDAAQVADVAARFLKPANRTVGTFIPDREPDRAQIPELENFEQMLAAHEFQESVRAAGARFDPTPANVHEHLIVRELSSGMRLAMLPKATRGERVRGLLVLRIGDEDSLRGTRTAAAVVPSMLMRGTTERSRQELRDRIDELQSRLGFGGGRNRGSASFETRREHLGELLALMAEAARKPAFDERELEELRRRSINQLREALTQPRDRALSDLNTAMTALDEDHPFYPASLERQIEGLRALTVDDLKSFHQRFYGAGAASLVLVGDFDPDEVTAAAEELFGDWAAEVAYQHIAEESHDPEGQMIEVVTPDRANATLVGALRIPLSDRHEDYAALALASQILGGGFLSSRLSTRIRDGEGLSYGVGARLSVESLDETGTLMVFAMFAPENRERLEEVLREELDKAVREGFTAEELEAARSGWLQARQVARGNDPELAGLINHNLAVGRDVMWEQKLDDAIRAVDLDTVNRVFRQYINPDRFTTVIAGDW